MMTYKSKKLLDFFESAIIRTVQGKHNHYAKEKQDLEKHIEELEAKALKTTKSKTPVETVKDLSKMTRALDGPYHIDRDRLAYLVSEAEYEKLVDWIRCTQKNLSEPKNIKILGIKIIKSDK